MPTLVQHTVSLSRPCRRRPLTAPGTETPGNGRFPRDQPWPGPCSADRDDGRARAGRKTRLPMTFTGDHRAYAPPETHDAVAARVWLDAAVGDAAIPPSAVVVGAAGAIAALRERRPDIRVVALELDGASARALRRETLARAWLDEGRLQVLEGPVFDGASDAWRVFEGGAEQPLVLVNPFVYRQSPTAAKAAIATAAAIARAAAGNGEARQRLGGRYLRQSLLSVPRLEREGDCGALQGLFAGVPIVLVAAGPSLDATVEDLARLRDRCLIVAVDTALRPLLHHGIVPELVASIDPTVPNARHLSNLQGIGDTWLVAEPSLHPAGLAAFAGRIFFGRVGGFHPWPWLNAHGVDRHQLTVWSSVLTAAFDVALLVGGDPLLFIGADLSFGGEQVYCRHTVYEEDWAQSTRSGEAIDDLWRRIIDNQRPVDVGSDGDTGALRSSSAMVSARDWMVARVRGVTDRTVLNCGGAGLLVTPEIRQATLREALGGRPALGCDARGLLRAAHGRASRPSVDVVRAARCFVAGASRVPEPQLVDQWARGVDAGVPSGLPGRPTVRTVPQPIVARLTSLQIVPRGATVLALGEFAPLVRTACARLRPDTRVIVRPDEGTPFEHHRLADTLDPATLPATFDVAVVASSYGDDIATVVPASAPVLTLPKQAINLLHMLFRPLPWLSHAHRVYPSLEEAAADPRLAAALAVLTDDVERVKYLLLSADPGPDGAMIDRLEQVAGSAALRDRVIDDLLATATWPERGMYVAGLDLSRVRIGMLGGVAAGTWLQDVLRRSPASARHFVFDPDRPRVLHGDAFPFLASDGRMFFSAHPLWDRPTEALVAPAPGRCSVIEYEGCDPALLRSGHYVSARTDTIDAFVERHDLGAIDLLILDIAGSEQRALQGAALTVSASRPQLAVAVHHSRAALTDIPLFLHGLLPGYRFWTANHVGFRPGQKTLLYGAPLEADDPPAPCPRPQGEP